MDFFAVKDYNLLVPRLSSDMSLTQFCLGVFPNKLKKNFKKKKKKNAQKGN